MAGAHFELDRLTAIIDANGLQLLGDVGDVMRVEPIADKWRAFGWEVIEIDGHDLSRILEACEQAASLAGPVVIVARTVKGKGVREMENSAAWHSAPISDEVRRRALLDLGVPEGGAG